MIIQCWVSQRALPAGSRLHLLLQAEDGEGCRVGRQFAETTRSGSHREVKQIPAEMGQVQTQHYLAPVWAQLPGGALHPHNLTILGDTAHPSQAQSLWLEYPLLSVTCGSWISRNEYRMALLPDGLAMATRGSDPLTCSCMFF